MAMKRGNPGIAYVSWLVVVVLCLALSSCEAAASKSAARHLRHSQGQVAQRSATLVQANDTDDDDTDDDDDDDDDDAEANVAPAMNTSEKEVLQAHVRAAHGALADNLKRQVELNIEIKELDDGAESNRKIEATQRAVANETQSPAVARFLADMWKEMRMFAKPFYKEHLEDQLAALEGKTPSLQADFSDSKAALSASTAPVAATPPAAAVVSSKEATAGDVDVNSDLADSD
eukprot:TRINITY_DN53_c1_g1_i1.p1 TRINITY_DN53_c1_g1~~TRINITY_DN53_c1_g1_i1.p1  ORF type:complete len:232 (+),score=77.44 TRINITY_DN53_c1_g1_i1:58-753(+)